MASYWEDAGDAGEDALPCVLHSRHRIGDAVHCMYHGDPGVVVLMVITEIKRHTRTTVRVTVAPLCGALFGAAMSYTTQMSVGDVFDVAEGDPSAAPGRCARGAAAGVVLRIGATASSADREAKREAYGDPRVAEMAEFTRDGRKTRARYYAARPPPAL
jgi:hypothetical protein